MRPLFKTVKVIYNAHQKGYEVWYRNWFFWNFDSIYKFDPDGDKYPIHYKNQETAKQMALSRAECMLKTVEVFRASSIL